MSAACFIKKGTAQTKSVVSPFCSRIFANENIPRLCATCQQLSPQKDYAGVCKFSRATARQKNFHTLIRAFYCGRCL